MNIPKELHYSKEHEWVQIDGDVATIGITDYAQDQLGDIVFVETPEVGGLITAGDSFGVVESVKTVSDIYAPLSGEVTEVNEELADHPELVNENPYGSGWIIKLKINNADEAEALLNHEAYSKLIKG